MNDSNPVAVFGTDNTVTNNAHSHSPLEDKDGYQTASVSTSTTTSSTTNAKRNQTSFTADSPYFTAYVDKEMKNLSILTSTLRDISSKAKTFGKCGVLMSEATRRLSSACKLQPNYKVDGSNNNGMNGNIDDSDHNGGIFNERSLEGKEKVFFEKRKNSVGNEMVGVLQVLGKVLDEVADAQISMCESLEAALSLSLETFIGTELEEASRLKDEAEEMTDNAETSFAKYLHGKHAQSSAAVTAVSDTEQSSSTVSSWNKISEGVGNQLGRIGIAASIAKHNDTSSLSPNKSRKIKNNTSADKSKDPMDKAITAACLRQNLEEIRFSQSNAELKRFQLLKHVDALKTRRNFGLGESILASLNGIKAYFHHCSDLIQGLTPKLQEIQHEQTKARQAYESQLKPLESRENGLLQAINEVKISAANAEVIADAISRGQTTGLGASMIADQPTSLEAIEEETKIWDITRLLTKHSLYIRDPKPTIEVEGWLYKKASTRMAMNTWSKRWFVLDKTGIYYLKGGSLSENGNFGSSNGSLERVKVCDIVLCTVREAKNNIGFRFCFEIISPNSRPYMLQACGPVEFNKWTLGIRKCLERQLVQGNVPSDDMLLRPDTPKAGRVIKGALQDQSDHAADSPIEKTKQNDGISISNSVSTMHSMQNSASKNPLIEGILSENRLCADCGQTRPEWVSLNLGVLICIECSGVHRSLGVHLSKVRSLKLDKLSRAEYSLLQALGNEFVNSVWEAGVNNQKGWKKPDPHDSRKVKEEWIKSKYMWKGFIKFIESDGFNQEERDYTSTKELFDASSRCDLHATVTSLAKGGDVNWTNDNKTPLEVCIHSGLLDNQDGKGMKTSEMLIQNGARIDALDQSVLDMALRESTEHDMVEYIMTRIA